MSFVIISDYSCSSYVNYYNGNVKEITLTLNNKPKEKKKSIKQSKKEDIEIDIEDETSGDEEEKDQKNEYEEDDFCVKDEVPFDKDILKGVVPDLKSEEVLTNDLDILTDDRIAFGKQDSYNVIGDVQKLTCPFLVFNLILRNTNNDKYELIKIIKVSRKCEVDQLSFKIARDIIKKIDIIKGVDKGSTFGNLLSKKQIRASTFITSSFVNSNTHQTIKNIFECFFLKDLTKFFSWYNYFIINSDNIQNFKNVETGITPTILESCEKMFFKLKVRSILFENIKLTDKLKHIYEASKIYNNYKNDFLKYGNFQYNESNDAKWTNEAFSLLKKQDDIECGVFTDSTSLEKRKYIRSKVSCESIKKLTELLRVRTTIIRAEDDFSDSFKSIFSKFIKEKNDVVIVKHNYRNTVYSQFSAVVKDDRISKSYCEIFDSYIIDRAHRYNYDSLLKLLNNLDLSSGKKIKLIGTPFYKSQENVIRDLLFFKDNEFNSPVSFNEYEELFGLKFINFENVFIKNELDDSITSNSITNVFFKDADNMKKYKENFNGKNQTLLTVNSCLFNDINPTQNNIIFQNDMNINDIITVSQNIVFGNKYKTIIIDNGSKDEVMTCKFVPIYNTFAASFKRNSSVIN